MTDLTDCRISLQETGFFSQTLSDYLNEKEALQAFHGLFPKPANFLEQIKAKQAHFSVASRQRLVKALQKQYTGLENVSSTFLTRLADEKTFTLTTGHQLNIFSGPLYFHYKILTVIRAAEALKVQFPDYNFVPVYWMASEDHDFEEIRSFRLFGKKWHWESEQTGAVGRFSTEGLEKIPTEIGERLNPFAQAYESSSTLAEATRKFVHQLYGKDGLVVIDADDPDLKTAFTPVIENDIFEHIPHKKVEATTKKLEELGYGGQIYPRPINFFYLKDGFRERIEETETGIFEVLNTEIRFSPEQIKEEIHAHPERFSPNVVLRPLLQEILLPNLSYTGGPSEVVYWFQLREVFAHFNVPFPILLPRNFVLYLDKVSQKKMLKAELSVKDLFLPEHKIKQRYVRQHAEGNLDLATEKADLTQIFERIATQAETVDASLVGWTKAQEANIQKTFDKIAHRLSKAEEQKHETALRHIQKVKDKLFPNGGLQERSDNVLNFLINDPEFLEKVKAKLDPFDFRLQVLVQEE